MFKRGDIVLIDTNVILEAHRLNCWKPFSDYFELHTVDKVIEETQTGFQNRRPEQTIDVGTLQDSFAHIENITDLQVIEFDMGNQEVALDDGEKALMIYAHSLSQKAWFLNSPDKASIRYACSKGWSDQLTSLDAMVKHMHLRLKQALKQNYTDSWLAQEKFKCNQQLY